MPQTGAGARGSAAGAARPAGRVRPRLGGLDIAVQLWRAKWLMLAVFFPLAAISLVGAVLLPANYTAASRLLVTPGDEYAYRTGAGAGEASSLASPQLGAMVQSEIELLRSPVAAQAALTQVTLARAFPAIAHSCKPEACEQLGIAAVSRSLLVTSDPGSPVITVRFAHREAGMSAEMLNALVSAYLAYRAEMLTDTRSDSLREQRERFEQDAAEADKAIRDYLFTNNLADLAIERDTVRQLYQSASGDLLIAQSHLRQAEAQLASYLQQIETIPPELEAGEVVIDPSLEQALIALTRDRDAQVTLYGDAAPGVQALDVKIARAEDEIASTRRAAQQVRPTLNPLYTQVEGAVATLRSEVQALRGRAAELRSQIADFEARQRRLVDLAPELEELERRRDVAQKSVTAMAEREVDVRLRNELALRGSNMIRVLEPATPPIDGASLRIPAAILGLLLAALAALAAGLMRAMSRSGFATPGSVERTLGLPVLATIQKY